MKVGKGSGDGTEGVVWLGMGQSDSEDTSSEPLTEKHLVFLM